MSEKRRLVAIVQARASSTRFPGKVLADLGGNPLLTQLLDRLCRSTEVAEVVLATSVAADDDRVAELGAASSVSVVRGPLDDVLERFRLAAELHDADAVVRITGDCPLVDPALVDEIARSFHDASADYVSNVQPPTFPDGLDVEIITRTALEQAAADATRASDREHVTLFVARHPARFTHRNVANDVDLSHLRWTVDYPDDLAFVRAVFALFPGREESFGYRDVLAALENDDALRKLMPQHIRNERLLEKDSHPSGHGPARRPDLREATADDVHAIWLLRNTAEVRIVSRRQYALDPVEFKREILAAIDDPAAEVLVIELGEAWAGYVRIDPRAADSFEISIALEARWRGLGLGPEVIETATREFLAVRPAATLHAVTLPDNIAARRAFEAAGYTPGGSDGEFLVYNAPRAT